MRLCGACIIWALGFGWLAWPILPPKMWPTVETKKKRAITREEHERIIATEKNPDRRLVLRTALGDWGGAN